jgi:RNA polymerase sigma factor (sigma-70 family)
MHAKSDAQLLREYVTYGSDAAFAEVVKRHANLVYSAALRQVESSDSAKDVAQNVFTDLARKASTLTISDGGCLVGWLYRGTRFEALNHRRAELRRQSRERQAMADLITTAETTPDWESLRPILDEAMSQLTDGDRDAVLLRYFKGQSLREVGAALGISDDTAQKRVSRAVERLRELFKERGVTVSAQAIVAAVSANAVQAAPVGLVATLAAVALAKPAAAATTAVTVPKGTLTTFQKMLAVGVGVAVIVVATYRWSDSEYTVDSTLHQQPEAIAATNVGLLDTSSKDSAETANQNNPGNSSTTNILEAQSDELASTPANHLKVFVQDEKNQTLAGVLVKTKVTASGNADAFTSFNASVSTDTRGIANVRWPRDSFKQLELIASKDEFASRKMTWDLNTGDTIPDTFTFTLKPGVHMSGYVVDPEGNPIADASSQLSRFWLGGEYRQEKGEQPAFSTERKKTDADGRWTLRNLPAELLNRTSFTISHSNFINFRTTMERSEVQKQLREGTYKTVLKRGLETKGRVVDESDQPIANAAVWAGQRFSGYRKETKTDENGRFSFQNITEGKIIFSVMADGFSPDSKTHTVDTAASELVFKLSPGGVVRGIVQDRDGQPVEGVRVALSGSPGEPAYDGYEFSQTTGADGRFEWKSAPKEPMRFYFGKKGYQQKRDVRLKPGEEHMIELSRNREVKGKVVDKDTGEPVTEFQVSVGRMLGQIFSTDAAPKSFKSRDGSFTIEVEEEQEDAIRVSAKEHAEEVQKLPIATPEEIGVVLRLQRTGPLKFALQTPEGQPVPGATIALVSPEIGGGSVQLGESGLRSFGAQMSTSDQSGSVEMPAPPEQHIIIAWTPDGFAYSPVAELRVSGLLILQPYGRIEGVVTRGMAYGSGQELTLELLPGSLTFAHQGYKALSDTQGRFVFERVPPGKLSILRLVKTGTNSWSHSHKTEVVVAPGRTTEITLGGMDATVIGQVDVSPFRGQADVRINAHLSTPTPKPPSNLRPEESMALFASPEWKEKVPHVKHFAAVVEPDGSLVLDTIPPGDYTLNIRATLPGSGFLGKEIGRTSVPITVPQGAIPSNPIDIGHITLTRTETDTYE